MRDRDGNSRTIEGIHLPMSGRHNVQNALAAVAVAVEMGVPDAVIRTGFAKFGGVKRRFTKVGEVAMGGAAPVTVIIGVRYWNVGFSIAIGDSPLFFLPGVPREMKRMFTEQVLPRIRPSAPNNTFQIRLRTYGLGESLVGQALAGVEGTHAGVTLGYRVQDRKSVV